MRVCFIVTGLEVGGAELALSRLIRRLNRSRLSPFVISLTGRGSLSEKLAASGITVYALDFRGGPVQKYRALSELVRCLRSNKPDIVQTWMYHADLLGGIIARVVTNSKVIWGIRNGLIDSKETKFLTRVTVRLCAILSRFIPDLIVTCAESAKVEHVRLGYPESKFRVIPNGVDAGYFRFDGAGRERVRGSLGIGGDTWVIGCIARFDPQKDHRTFLESAALLRRKRQDVVFILCGKGCTDENVTLRDWIQEMELGDSVLMLGERDDIPAVMSALDIHVLTSSYGEAFPNAVAEAKACERLSVSTDIGDAAFIISNEVFICPVGDYNGLCEILMNLISMDRNTIREIGIASRTDIEKRFAIQESVEQYTEMYTGGIP